MRRAGSGRSRGARPVLVSGLASNPKALDLADNGGWGGIACAALRLSRASASARTAFSSLERFQVCLRQSGGWGGIRTLGALLHTRFPSVRNRPLCHPSLETPLLNTDRRGAASRGQGSRVFQRSRSRTPAEMATVVARMMKSRSMNVFTPASRTQGVGHRLG